MTLAMTIKAAEEIGVSPRHAAIARLRFLMPRIRELERSIFGLKRKAAIARTEKARTGHEALAVVEQHELDPLKVEARILQSFINGKVKLREAKPSEITSEMVDSARSYPFEKLLGQTPKGAGKVVCCPFHDDSSPSASVKHNHLVCFAGCRPKNGKKGWDPISFLMERDGISFPEAVIALQP